MVVVVVVRSVVVVAATTELLLPSAFLLSTFAPPLLLGSSVLSFLWVWIVLTCHIATDLPSSLPTGVRSCYCIFCTNISLLASPELGRPWANAFLLTFPLFLCSVLISECVYEPRP